MSPLLSLLVTGHLGRWGWWPLPDNPPVRSRVSRVIRVSGWISIGLALLVLLLHLELIDEGLDGSELLSQVAQMSFQSVELFIQVIQSLRQRLNPGVVGQQTLVVVLQQTLHLAHDVIFPVVQDLGQISHILHIHFIRAGSVVPLVRVGGGRCGGRRGGPGPGPAPSTPLCCHHSNQHQHQPQGQFRRHFQSQTCASEAPQLLPPNVTKTHE